MTLAISLFFVGLLLSAFFSGTETGMYRVSRTRLVLDALDGAWMARAMVALLNRPTIFVATALTGNNLANYLISLGIVMLAQRFSGSGSTAELLATMLMAPVVFVLGELLPKYLFFNAPYRLLKAGRPFLLATTILFLPVSMFLGLLGKLLQAITGETPFQLRLAMERSELEQVFKEGHEAGVLAAGQRDLARNIFDIGSEPAIRFGVPVERLAMTSEPIDPAEAKKESRRKGHPIILVQRGKTIVGFLNYAQVALSESPIVEPVVRCSQDEHHFGVLLKLLEAGSDVAVLVDTQGRTRGIVTRRQLTRSFLTNVPSES